MAAVLLVVHRWKGGTMSARIVSLGLVVMWVGVGGFPAAGQEEKKTGTIVGELKSKHDTKDGKNTAIEVLAPGEEKARKYLVQYDPKVKGPIKSVLEAVRAAKVGSRVELVWVQTGHGPMITSFKEFKKGEREKDKK
jgi:hypothetical protein